MHSERSINLTSAPKQTAQSEVQLDGFFRQLINTEQCGDSLIRIIVSQRTDPRERTGRLACFMAARRASREIPPERSAKREKYPTQTTVQHRLAL